MEQRHLQVVFKIFISMVERFPEQGGGGVLPFISYIGVCGAKEYGFWVVLVWNRVKMLTILVWKSENRYGF